MLRTQKNNPGTENCLSETESQRSSNRAGTFVRPAGIHVVGLTSSGLYETASKDEEENVPHHQIVTLPQGSPHKSELYDVQNPVPCCENSPAAVHIGAATGSKIDLFRQLSSATAIFRAVTSLMGAGRTKESVNAHYNEHFEIDQGSAGAAENVTSDRDTYNCGRLLKTASSCIDMGSPVSAFDTIANVPTQIPEQIAYRDLKREELSPISDVITVTALREVDDEKLDLSLANKECVASNRSSTSQKESEAVLPHISEVSPESLVFKVSSAPSDPVTSSASLNILESTVDTDTDADQQPKTISIVFENNKTTDLWTDSSFGTIPTCWLATRERPVKAFTMPRTPAEATDESSAGPSTTPSKSTNSQSLLKRLVSTLTVTGMNGKGYRMAALKRCDGSQKRCTVTLSKILQSRYNANISGTVYGYLRAHVPVTIWGKHSTHHMKLKIFGKQYGCDIYIRRRLTDSWHISNQEFEWLVWDLHEQLLNKYSLLRPVFT